MNFKFILLIFTILINFVISLPLFSKRSQVNFHDLFLSNDKNFNYNEIKNLVVFGDSHSSENDQWNTILSKMHSMKHWNFAKSGAVVDLNITYRGSFNVDFIKEYKSFYNTMINYRNSNQWNGNNTLFAMHLGSNDIKIIYIKKDEYSPQTSKQWMEYINNDKLPAENIKDVINIIFDKIRDIYNNGGRNFLLFYLPPFELTNVNQKRKMNYKTGIPIFNSVLNQKSKELSEELKDINIIIYNLNEEYRKIINNYKSYNFVSGTEIFTGQIKSDEHKNEYFWLDHTHITEKGNSIIAEGINALLKSINA